MKNIPLIITCIIITCYSCNDKLQDIRKTFGTDKNIDRKDLYLVTVDPRFQLNEDPGDEGRLFIFVNKKELELKTPDFLRKIILLDSARQHIMLEQDHFKNPVERKYLIAGHDYFSGRTIIYLEDINDSLPGNRSVAVNLKQADSIVKSWNVQTNPFKQDRQ